MAWQILAMWGVVMASISWFVRDERRLLANASMAQARWCHAYALRCPQPSGAQPPPAANSARPEGLTQTQRNFLEAFAQKG